MDFYILRKIEIIDNKQYSSILIFKNEKELEDYKKNIINNVIYKKEDELKNNKHIVKMILATEKYSSPLNPSDIMTTVGNPLNPVVLYQDKITNKIFLPLKENN